MKKLCPIFLTGFLSAMAGDVLAYNPITHGIIADYAMRQSVLNAPDNGVLESLGLGTDVDDRRFLLPSTYSSTFPYPWTLTPMRLVQFGVQEEDEGTRALNHFFDPQNDGSPLHYFGQRGDAAPDWGLEDRFEISEQNFSYKDARESLFEALTRPAKSERDHSLGRVFESLGHIIHLIQDMAQPQHVRNDIHCDQAFTPIFGSFLFRLPVCPFTLAYRPSAYEAYTLRQGGELPLGGYAVTDYGTFDVPRKFWENSGRGIAEFTSNNFVSAGTNFHGGITDIHADAAYPMPSPSPSAAHTAMQIEDLLGPMGPGQPLRGQIWFVSTPIQDRYRAPQPEVNHFTSSYSIFNSDLTSLGVDAVFTLNRFNYAAANAYLLPRAAAYSVGMIDYFFRGRIEISLPSNGVYSAVDHAVTNATGQGFTKFKVKLRNATPSATPPGGGEIPQEMSGGTLVAIAKYYPNNCYRPDLLGEYDGRPFSGSITPSGCTWLDYILSSEEIAVSQEQPGVRLDRNTPAEFTFDFSAKSIPINARDLSIQIVYRGALGSESDAIVVSGKNISEPTYIAVLNMSDYLDVNGQLHTPEEIRNSPSLRDQVRALGFDPDTADIDPEPLLNVRLLIGNVPVTVPKTLQPKTYLRIAVLSEVDAKVPLASPVIPVTVRHDFFPSITFPYAYNMPTLPLQNQLARPPAVISNIGILRGLPYWRLLNVLKGAGAAPAQLAQLTLLDPSCGGPVTFSCAPMPTAVPILFP